MLFLTIWGFSLVSFINSYLKKYSKDIQWAFFIAFLGVVFTKTPNIFNNDELIRLTKFFGQLLFLGSHIYIQIKSQISKFLNPLIWIQKASLLAVYLNCYMRWPGSKHITLLNLILIPFILSKFKSLNGPLKWSLFNLFISVMIILGIIVSDHFNSLIE